jgi:hypothetical protein
MAWREKYKVHPAADVFPMMSDEELAALGEDIKKNGLREHLKATHDELVLDGRNRLEAMERVGLEHDDRFEFIKSDPVAYAISANIHRRHLTKAQQADLIVQAIKAGASHQVDEVPKRHVKGKAGSEKDPIKAAAVAAAAEHGISKSTVERSMAKANGKTPKPRPVEPDDYQVPDDYDHEPGMRHRGLLHCLDGEELKDAGHHLVWFEAHPEQIGEAMIEAAGRAAAEWSDLRERLWHAKEGLPYLTSSVNKFGTTENDAPGSSVAAEDEDVDDEIPEIPEGLKRKRGRPPGSKNKCKACAGTGRVIGKTGVEFDCACVKREEK